MTAIKVYVVVSAYEFSSNPLSYLVVDGVYPTYKKACEEVDKIEKRQSKKIEKRLVWIMESTGNFNTE